MFKISFNGNTIYWLTGVCRLYKKISNRIMSASPLFTPGQTIQKMHCILQEGMEKKANIFLVLGQ